MSQVLSCTVWSSSSSMLICSFTTKSHSHHADLVMIYWLQTVSTVILSEWDPMHWTLWIFSKLQAACSLLKTANTIPLMKVLISSWCIQFTNMKRTLQSTFSSCQSSRLFDEAVLKLTVPFRRTVEDQLSNCISCTSVFYRPLPVCSELTSCVWERRGGSKWMAPPMHFILQGMSEG